MLLLGRPTSEGSALPHSRSCGGNLIANYEDYVKWKEATAALANRSPAERNQGGWPTQTSCYVYGEMSGANRRAEEPRTQKISCLAFLTSNTCNMPRLTCIKQHQQHNSVIHYMKNNLYQVRENNSKLFPPQPHA